MHALIVSASPEPKSTNARLAAAADTALRSAGWTVEKLDLYAEFFDPVEAPRHYRDRAEAKYFDAQIEQRAAFEERHLPEDIRASVRRLNDANLLILQYPLWWFGTPAILKGWFDRVFVYGGFYSGKNRYERGAMAERRALVSVTVGDSEDAYKHDGLGGDLAALLWPTHYTLRFVGFSIVQPVVTFGVHGGLNAGSADSSSVEARIKRSEQILIRRLPSIDQETELPFNCWQDFAENDRLKPGAPVYSPFIRKVRTFDSVPGWPGVFAPERAATSPIGSDT